MLSCLRINKSKEEADDMEALMVKNGAILMEKLIASSNGKYYPFRIFSMEQLKTATNNFEKQKDIITYPYHIFKGNLQGRQILAVKFNYKEFEHSFNPVIFASQVLSHKNFLKLVGCCLETKIPISVFEYVECNTLADHVDLLHDHHQYPRHCQFEPLLWSQRLKIAMGTANALAYLHVGFSRPIVFSNIKLWNILFDKNCDVKLFDFSEAVSIPEGETHIKSRREVTNMYCPSLGFDAPERYLGWLNEKCDVYGFGVLLLVLLTGKPSYYEVLDYEDDGYIAGIDLVDHVLEIKKLCDNHLCHLVDKKIGTGGRLCPEIEQQAQVILELALRCVSKQPEDRPTIVDAAKQLRQLYRSTEHLIN